MADLLSSYLVSTICLLFSLQLLCLPMMFAFLTMFTDTESKPANEYEYMEEPKPVYAKKVVD